MKCLNCGAIVQDIPKRSGQQNRYLWSYYGLISQETGHTEREIHEWAKRMFLPPRYVKIMGKEMKLPASTTLLSKSEMSEYLDRISAATNVPLPNPEDKGYIQNYETPWRKNPEPTRIVTN